MATDAAIAAVFAPVQSPTTFEETVERMGSAIRLGILAPGSRLPPERELAERLQIARSTLREALGALVECGLLTAVRGRRGGTFVVADPPLATGDAGPLPDDWRDVLDLRVAIEMGALSVAVERIGPEALGLMREAVARMDAATGFEDFRRADARFHIAIAEASGIRRLVTVMTRAQADVTELLAHMAHPPQVLRHANADHSRLVDALARGERDRAAHVLRMHLAGTEHVLAGLMFSEATAPV